MTTVGDVKAALLALWSDVFDPAEVQITYGNRVNFSLDKRITIGDVTGRTAKGPSLGPARQHSEDYEVICKISYTVNGTPDDQKSVTDTVLEMFEGAEHAVRNVPNEDLGVSGVILAVVEGNWSLSEPPASDTGGPINANYEFRVRVQARFRLP